MARICDAIPLHTQEVQADNFFHRARKGPLPICCETDAVEVRGGVQGGGMIDAAIL